MQTSAITVHAAITYIIIFRWACPSQKEGDGLQAIVLLYCIIAMNIVVPVTTERSLLQRRGGARKPINALMIVAIGAGMYYVGSPAI